MKGLHILLVGCCLFCSCGRDDGPAVLHLTFDSDMPLYGEVAATKAVSDGMRCRIRVYREENGALLPVPVASAETAAAEGLTLPFPLEDGHYRFVAWTSPDGYYDMSDWTGICAGGKYEGCTEAKDAFLGCVEADMGSSGGDVEMVCSRPLAKWRFVAGDATGDDAGKYSVTFRYADFCPVSYNAVTDFVADAAQGISFSGNVETDTDGEVIIGYDYVFVNTHETAIKVSAEVVDASGNSFSTSVITVPLMRGMVTTVTGNFLTGKSSGNAGVDADFNGDYNIIIQ